jgi:transcriptional regulator GlxA family with amidase domain
MLTRAERTRFSFFLVDEFSAMCLMSAVEALRAANYVLGRKVYEWRLVTVDGAAAKASNGLRIEAESKLSDEFETDYFFIVSSFINNPPFRSKLHARLRQLDRQGIALGALSCGTFILARAGLLNDARCTVHWEYQPAFAEEFPEIALTQDVYVIDKRRYTSSGGIAGMEMMLQIIAAQHGPAVSQKVANNFQLDRVRGSGASQRGGALARLESLPQAVQQAVKIMLDNVEQPLSNAEIAPRIKTSVRNLERMFKRNLQASPAKFYLSLRLEKARELLMHTNLATLDVALQCGFSSSSYFARCFQREFGQRPSEIRRAGAALAVMPSVLSPAWMGAR